MRLTKLTIILIGCFLLASITAIPVAVQAAEDPYEQNDTQASAWDVKAGSSFDTHRCNGTHQIDSWLFNNLEVAAVSGEEDWFKVMVPKNARVTFMIVSWGGGSGQWETFDGYGMINDGWNTFQNTYQSTIDQWYYISIEWWSDSAITYTLNITVEVPGCPAGDSLIRVVPAGSHDVDFGDAGHVIFSMSIETTRPIEVGFKLEKVNPKDADLGDALIFFDLTSNDSDAINFPVQIQFFYDPQALDDLGMDEDELAVYYYNEDNGEWEDIYREVNGAENYVWFELEHFSFYGVARGGQEGNGSDSPFIDGFNGFGIVAVLGFISLAIWKKKHL